MSHRILFVNVTMAGYTGTEVVTRDLALGLAGRGHHISVCAPVLGPLADELIAAGIHVTSRLDDIVEPPDIVHGHHYLQTVDALLRFTEARGVFVCHDRTAAHSIPPTIDRIRRYVAVDHNCLERLRDDWRVPEPLTRVIFNAVDMRRFSSRGPLPEKPARALVFSHYASPSTHEGVVREACAQVGVPVDVMGSVRGTGTSTPEAVLGQYDLVFAKARCALEAMAVGAAVVLCDASGTGPMVTLNEVAGLRLWNFGARMLGRQLDAAALVREIRRYDPGNAGSVSKTIREQASLDLALGQYEAVYDDIMAEDGQPAASFSTLAAPLLRRLSELERDLVAYRRPERMPALSDAAVAAIHATLDDAPATMRAGSRAFVAVRLRNDVGGEPLGAWPPFPMQWAFRWRAEASADFLDGVDVRTPFRQAVLPGTEEAFVVDVQAPQEPGRFVLRITLVQEALWWLDRAATPVHVDVPVDVTER